MTCPVLACGGKREACQMAVCGQDIAAFRRFQQVGGFVAIRRAGAPPVGPRRKRGRHRDAARIEAMVRAYMGGATMQQVADEFNVTRQRVQQVLAREDIAGREMWSARTAAKHEDARLAELLRRTHSAKPCVVCGAWVLRKPGKTGTCSPNCAEVWKTYPPRFWSKVNKDGPGGCWLWTGLRNSVTGYGILVWGKSRSSSYAHRVSYEMAKGPIPAGLTIDHVYERGCRHRHCVNPAHLEAVTLRENVLRSPFAQAAKNARKTHCPAGHRYEDGPASCDNCRDTRRRRSGILNSRPCIAVNLDGSPCRRRVFAPDTQCHVHAGAARPVVSAAS